jgi:hypothetical protein
MKKITLLITIAIISICTLYAQSPDQFNYQAVLRNADGTIMADESVSVYVEILEETESGTSVFNETHNLTTTDLGLNSNINRFIRRPKSNQLGFE